MIYLHYLISWIPVKTFFMINTFFFYFSKNDKSCFSNNFFKGKQWSPFLYKYFTLPIEIRGHNVSVILYCRFCSDIISHMKIFIFKIIISQENNHSSGIFFFTEYINICTYLFNFYSNLNYGVIWKKKSNRKLESGHKTNFPRRKFPVHIN